MYITGMQEFGNSPRVLNTLGGRANKYDESRDEFHYDFQARLYSVIPIIHVPYHEVC